MVLVFKTNVQEVKQGKRIIEMLLSYFPGSEISFDLDDCDKVLRIKYKRILKSGIINLVNKYGFNCEELQD